MFDFRQCSLQKEISYISNRRVNKFVLHYSSVHILVVLRIYYSKIPLHKNVLKITYLFVLVILWEKAMQSILYAHHLQNLTEHVTSSYLYLFASLKGGQEIYLAIIHALDQCYFHYKRYEENMLDFDVSDTKTAAS